MKIYPSGKRYCCEFTNLKVKYSDAVILNQLEKILRKT